MAKPGSGKRDLSLKIESSIDRLFAARMGCGDRRGAPGDLQIPGRERGCLIYWGVGREEDRMVRQSGIFDVGDRLAGLSKKGYDLERLRGVVDFELFRPGLERAARRAARTTGGRPPFDHVLMFKVL